ncbi:hypothetical protein HI914_05786 [Erysiphe necator]|uniref:Putative ankyrin repeat domain-containing protein n=1 Tax=Uncinula necator TaxID=52586 RepID=A0A0B1P5C5_UNCNE|nr:hypothetical protein HI914_05786 [Erysiphe necator]KHJ33483.1 putative ankyrin repeat domain-containing protein [Erysiphe necator]
MENSNKFPLHEAARDGRARDVESILNENPKLANQRDDDNRLAVHWAISSNQKEIVNLLVSTEYFDPDAQDGSGWTPLMIAASLKEGEEIVDLLLGKNADINAKNFAGQTALHLIVSKKNIDLARRFLNHKPAASARLCDKRGLYPIHRAAAVGSVPLVELLIKHNSPINAADISGQTPLHHAIAEGHGDTALSLLKAGVDTKKRDSDEKLALELAPDLQIKKFIIRQAELEGIEL